MMVEVTTKQVNEVVDGLNQKYENHGHAFRIERIAGGLQMLTLPQYNGYLKKLLRARDDSKLSPAALETLAIVAYKQPVIRTDIEAIRGVACGEVLRSLMVKGLVKIVGRAEIIGRPMQYGTTRKFLEIFGLNSLKDLPSIEELKRPDGPKALNANWEKGSLIRETDLIPPSPQEESGSPPGQG
jgi:segregation and condensation protein B